MFFFQTLMFFEHACVVFEKEKKNTLGDLSAFLEFLTAFRMNLLQLMQAIEIYIALPLLL